jgi:carbon monoxide dehydrogenase subunit G
LEQSGEYLITASRDVVWQALNDPSVLQQCIAGCLSMDKVSDAQFDSKVKAKIGPVSATFTAQLMLSEMVPPTSYTITANVKGGPAGFGKGVAKVSLADGDIAESTHLSYAVDASVGGKLAQIGSRLLDAAARKMADDFFSAFGELVGGSPVVKPGVTPNDLSSSELKEDTSENHWWIWGLVFGGLAIALVLAM